MAAKQFQFLHLGINFKTMSPNAGNLEEIELVLNGAKDWFRYAPNCWLIYTSRDPKVWGERLKKIPWMKAQNYLICPMNLKDRSGWLPRSVWDWINAER